MTNKQRRILEDAEISSELMHEVDHYLKDGWCGAFRYDP